MSKSTKVECPVCRQFVGLNNAGRINRHGHRHGAGIGGGGCFGWGWEPTATALDIVTAVGPAAYRFAASRGLVPMVGEYTTWR